VKIILLLIVLAASFDLKASAQDNNLKQENTITTPVIVSASSFQEELIDYPGSASIIELNNLERPQKMDFQEILQSVPNLNFSGGSSESRFFQIRGIGELEQYEGAPNPSVGLIYDDFDISGLGSPFTLFDVDKVEVLRGPQATEFGANGLAGVINIKSTEPTLEQSLNSELSIGSDNLLNVGLAFGSNVFKSESLSYRISAANQSQDGFRENLFLNKSDTNNRHKSDTRMQFRYEPDQDTQVDLEVVYALQDSGYDAFAINNAFTTQSDRPGKDRHELYGTKLALKQSLSEDLDFSSITSFSDSELDYGFDGDWGNNPFWEPYAPYDYRSLSLRDRSVLSQELKLQNKIQSQHSWSLGLFGQDLDEDSEISEFADEVIYDYLDSTYEAQTFAAFGAYEVKILKDSSLGFNLRSERRNMEYSDSNSQQIDPDYNMDGGSVFLKNQLNENTQIYSLISRGFKGGGFNAGTRVPAADIEYQPETLWNYEIGTKGSALNSDLNYSLSLFFMQREDQQVKLAFQDDPSDPLSYTYLTDNAAEGENYGAELESSYKINDRLSARFNLGLLNTKIQSIDSSLSNLLYREQSHAPNCNFLVSTIYKISEKWYFSPNLSGSDEFYFDDSHDQKSNPYYLLTAEVGWISDYLRLSIWAKNITNEKYATRGFYFGNEPPNFDNTLYTQRGDPFSFGVSVSYSF
jgi:iron complex outermembrane receptor protein